jgi:hypothetical protein
MPVARYFLFVGGVLIALLFAINAILPPEAAVHSAPGIDRSTVRIRSDQKLPERVVYDTTLPTIVPASKVQTAAAPAPVPALETSAQTRVHDTFAQFIPGEPKKVEQKAEQGVLKGDQMAAARVEQVAPPKKRKIARVHSAPPYGYPPYGPPMRVAQQQQQRFGFFGGPIWNTW